MKPHDPIQENDVNDDAVWNLLGKADPAKASGRFADDVVRSIRLLPEAESVWTKFFKLTPVVGVAACAVFAFLMLMDQPSDSEMKPSGGEIAAQEVKQAQWERIEDAAEVEMLLAAVDHLDEFSDQELVTMIGL
jgi:hypothetical protein